MDHCWYVTDRWTVHDERWIVALINQGFEPNVLSLSKHGISLEDIKAKIEQGDQTWPVLAGPLTTVTSELISLPNRIIGLSWGFDLIDAHKEATTWLAQVDHLIVDSVVTQSMAIRAGLAETQVSLIPWGIDLHQFRPEGTSADLTTYGIDPGQPTVLSLRAHEPLYRVVDLIEAWPLVLEHHSDAVALIGNVGSLTEELHRAAVHIGVSDHIRFIGALPETELPPLLRSASCYVSTSPVDGTSVTMLQAMACGAPVITSDTPGNRDWITPDITGTLVELASPTELAAAITAVLNDAGSMHQEQQRRTAMAEVERRADWSRNICALGTAIRGS